MTTKEAARMDLEENKEEEDEGVLVLWVFIVIGTVSLYSYKMCGDVFHEIISKQQ